MAYAPPKTIAQIQTQIVSVLNDNLTDPYEQATGNTRSDFARGDDYKHTGVWPKIHVDISDSPPEKINSTTKSNFLEQETITVMIYYMNFKGHRYTPSGESVVVDEAQNIRFREYIKTTLKANVSDFGLYFHQMSFGSIDKPSFNAQTKIFTGVLPMACRIYRR